MNYGTYTKYKTRICFCNLCIFCNFCKFVHPTHPTPKVQYSGKRINNEGRCTNLRFHETTLNADYPVVGACAPGVNNFMRIIAFEHNPCVLSVGGLSTTSYI